MRHTLKIALLITAVLTQPLATTFAATTSVGSIEKEFEELKKDALSTTSQANPLHVNFGALKNRVEDKIKAYQENDREVKIMNQKVGDTYKRIEHIGSQIGLLDEEIRSSEQTIDDYKKKIIDFNEAIHTLEEDINTAQAEIHKQKEVLLDYIVLVYRQKLGYYNFETQSIDDVKLFFSDEKLFEPLRQSRYLEIVEDTGQEILGKLIKLTQLLREKKTILEERTDELNGLKIDSERENKALSDKMLTKKYLLDTTQQEQTKYLDLLDDAKEEQASIVAEMATLNNSIGEISRRLGESASDKGLKLTQEELTRRAQEIADLYSSTSGSLAFLWPVEPRRGVSAFFHDTGYIAHFGMDHNAIDIPTPQATPIMAPRDGYVYKVKDAPNNGYSYIMLSHDNGFMSLYGHVNEILVSPGEKISVGQVIGLSGGTPGTHGAGLMTTGAHLHFEMFKDGKHIDPLLVLDNSKLPQ